MNIWLITGIVGAGLFLANSVSAKTTSPSLINPSPANPTNPSPSEFPLKLGSKGTFVKALQTILYKVGNDSVRSLLMRTSYNKEFDGIFGQGTQQALAIVTKSTTIDYQSFLNLIKKANA